MRMVSGGVDAASAHDVGASRALIQVLKLTDNLAQFETRIGAGKMVGRSKHLLMNVQAVTSCDFD